MIRSPADATCLLVVAPHPDDDILGCSYLMRAVADRGGHIIVVWMTDGGASHGDCGAAARKALVATRRREALAGIAALEVNPAATYFLDYPDGHLARYRMQATVALRTIAARHDVEALCVTGDGDAHPDHRASYVIAAAVPVASRFAYAISARYDGDTLAPCKDAIALAGQPEVKRAALLCHASQQDCGGARFPMTASAIHRFCTEPEYFMPIDC